MSKTGVTRVPFKRLVATSTTSLAQTLKISPPTLQARLDEIGETFQLYRVTKLKFRLHPTADTVGTVAKAACYVSGGVSTAPSSVAQVCVNPISVFSGDFATTPTEWQHVPSAILQGSLPWYKTIASGSVDDWEEVQGAIYVVAVATDTVSYLEVVGMCEFKDPVSSGVTSEQLRALRREKLLSLLSTPPAASPSVSGKALSAEKTSGSSTASRIKQKPVAEDD